MVKGSAKLVIILNTLIPNGEIIACVCFFKKNVAFLLVDQEICCTFAVALFGNVSEKAV